MAKTYRTIPSLTPQLIEHFWSKIDKSPGQGTQGDCWEWKAGRIPQGYGAFGIRRKNFPAHRIAYLITHGCIDNEKCVCHTCDNPPCCNPAHLWEGTLTENAHDMQRKGRKFMGAKASDLMKLKAVRGEAQGISKITAQAVREIRRKFNPPNINLVTLAREYGVRKQTIKQVVSRMTWRHVID